MLLLSCFSVGKESCFFPLSPFPVLTWVYRFLVCPPILLGPALDVVEQTAMQGRMGNIGFWGVISDLLVQASSDTQSHVNHLCALPVWQLVKLEMHSSCMLLNTAVFSFVNDHYETAIK